jgi:hypothetical protein
MTLTPGPTLLFLVSQGTYLHVNRALLWRRQILVSVRSLIWHKNSICRAFFSADSWCEHDLTNVCCLQFLLICMKMKLFCVRDVTKTLLTWRVSLAPGLTHLFLVFQKEMKTRLGHSASNTLPFRKHGSKEINCKQRFLSTFLVRSRKPLLAGY